MAHLGNRLELARQAEQAFDSELPSLSSTHGGEWVGYRGTQRVALAGSKAEVYMACRRAGLSDDEVLVRSIEARLDELIIGPDEVFDDCASTRWLPDPP